MNQILENFLKVGLAVAKVTVPGVAQAEAVYNGIKQGKDKKELVLEAIRTAPEVLEALKGNEDIVDNALFNEAVSEINDGYAKLMKSFQKKPNT